MSERSDDFRPWYLVPVFVIGGLLFYAGLFLAALGVALGYGYWEWIRFWYDARDML